MERNVSFPRRITFMVILVLGLLIGSEAAAQRFQYVYGNVGCSEAGRYGVAQVSTGGYITVGETGCPGAGTDIYVVRTNINGTQMWAWSYSIGHNDSATDVIEDANGDFVICGVTDNGGPCPASRDMFILRLTPAGLPGAVPFVNTYGSPTSDEIAWNIVETASNYVLSGSTTFFGGAMRDGYIVSVSKATLAFGWDGVYGGGGDDYFYGVDEIQTDGTGDIVAVGGSNSWSFGGYDVFIVRVSGANGTIGLPPQNAAIYGRNRDDEGRAIIELRNGARRGDLVITGISFSRPLPSTNSEVLMLETQGDPCIWVADQYAGDDDPHPDGGIDLKEDIHMPSCVIVTGFTDFGNFGALTPPNVFLERFAIGTMVPVFPAALYGGNTIDWGWSVNNVVASRPGETNGYIVSGFSQSPPIIAPDPVQQLYLIKTDVGLSSGCNEMNFTNIFEPIFLFNLCPQAYRGTIRRNCVPNVNYMPMNQWWTLCYAPFGARERGGNENDGVSGVESPAVITFNEGTVTSYPNPVVSGAEINLRFQLSAPAAAQITVSDIVGRVIAQREATIKGGSDLHAIETDGWNAGSYLVRITIGEKSSTTRIVVHER